MTNVSTQDLLVKYFGGGFELSANTNLPQQVRDVAMGYIRSVLPFADEVLLFEGLREEQAKPFLDHIRSARALVENDEMLLVSISIDEVRMHIQVFKHQSRMGGMFYTSAYKFGIQKYVRFDHATRAASLVEGMVKRGDKRVDPVKPVFMAQQKDQDKGRETYTPVQLVQTLNVSTVAGLKAIKFDQRFHFWSAVKDFYDGIAPEEVEMIRAEASRLKAYSEAGLVQQRTLNGNIESRAIQRIGDAQLQKNEEYKEERHKRKDHPYYVPAGYTTWEDYEQKQAYVIGQRVLDGMTSGRRSSVLKKEMTDAERFALENFREERDIKMVAGLDAAAKRFNTPGAPQPDGHMKLAVVAYATMLNNNRAEDVENMTGSMIFDIFYAGFRDLLRMVEANKRGKQAKIQMPVGVQRLYFPLPEGRPQEVAATVATMGQLVFVADESYYALKVGEETFRMEPSPKYLSLLPDGFEGFMAEIIDVKANNQGIGVRFQNLVPVGDAVGGDDVQQFEPEGSEDAPAFFYQEDGFDDDGLLDFEAPQEEQVMFLGDDMLEPEVTTYPVEIGAMVTKALGMQGVACLERLDFHITEQGTYATIPGQATPVLRARVSFDVNASTFNWDGQQLTVSF